MTFSYSECKSWKNPCSPVARTPKNKICGLWNLGISHLNQGFAPKRKMCATFGKTRRSNSHQFWKAAWQVNWRLGIAWGRKMEHLKKEATKRQTELGELHLLRLLMCTNSTKKPRSSLCDHQALRNFKGTRIWAAYCHHLLRRETLNNKSFRSRLAVGHQPSKMSTKEKHKQMDMKNARRDAAPFPSKPIAQDFLGSQFLNTSALKFGKSP